MQKKLLLCICISTLLVACGTKSSGENVSDGIEKEVDREDNLYGDINGDGRLDPNEQEMVSHEEPHIDIETEENGEMTEEEQETSIVEMDDRYLILDVIGKNSGDVILEDEKFWVLTAYSESGSVGDVQTLYYIYTDSKLKVYEKIVYETFGEYRMEDYILGNALLVFSPGANVEYYLVDSEGNIINTQYINDNEKILGMYKDDNGINIFTALVEETVSSQNIIFNIYDENKNVKFSFSKNELESQNGTTLNLVYDDLNILDGYGENMYRIDDDIYVDTTRGKAFVITESTVRVRSNGSQIITGNSVIDLESEKIQSYGGIFFNNSPVKAYSRLTDNDTFLFEVNGSYAIFDIYNNLVSDLTRENAKTTYHTDYYDGYMLIEYENEGKTTFLTVIDSNGEWQFESIQGTIKYIDEYIPQTGQFIAWDNEQMNTLLIDKFGNIEELQGVMAGQKFVIIENGNEKKYLIWETSGARNPVPFRILTA